jgi:hypothetical protein
MRASSSVRGCNLAGILLALVACLGLPARLAWGFDLADVFDMTVLLTVLDDL